MSDANQLVYFYGEWLADERETVSLAALAATPSRIQSAWNAKLGHLWVVVHRDDGWRIASLGNETVTAETAEGLAERIQSHDWTAALGRWVSTRGNGRFRS